MVMERGAEVLGGRNWALTVSQVPEHNFQLHDQITSLFTSANVVFYSVLSKNRVLTDSAIIIIIDEYFIEKIIYMKIEEHN